MTNTTTRRTKIARMTLLAMLVAVLIVLAFVNIPMPMGLSITFNMIPVAIAVMAMGMSGGLIIGGAFGLISFLQCFGIFGFSALGAALVNYNPFLMFVQRFVSREEMLNGYHHMAEILTEKDCASAVCPGCGHGLLRRTVQYAAVHEPAGDVLRQHG